MLENLILWLIIGIAVIYASRNIYRILTGKSKGCSCEGGCEIQPPQQIIPDLKGQTAKKDQRSS